MKNNLLKLSCLSLSLLMAFSLCSCNQNGDQKATTEPSSMPSESSASNESTSGDVLEIDFTSISGEFKPVNGMNNGPKTGHRVDGDQLTWTLDATEYYQELGIPFVRTHDMEYPHGGERFVDIHCIFPDFSADPDDPASYDFAGTDEYITAIVDSGAEVFYRLGESIGYYGDPESHIDPPADYEKWAKICDRIIAHYNEGWDNGFEYHINYWEIWNEPDVAMQWTGTIEDYYEFYRTVARFLKERHPDIKIGAAALASANETNVREFLKGITSDGEACPLDFYSWHIYDTDPARFDWRANVVRAALDEYGYEATMVFLGEWNHVEDWADEQGTWDYIASSDAAVYYSACLINMLHLPIDGAMYYDGSLLATWCGLYKADGETLPGYKAFLYFADLKSTGQMVNVPVYQDAKASGIYIAAGTGEKDGILVSNYSDHAISFLLRCNSEKSKYTAYWVNAENPQGYMSPVEVQIDEEGIKNLSIQMSAKELLYITIE